VAQDFASVPGARVGPASVVRPEPIENSWVVIPKRSFPPKRPSATAPNAARSRAGAKKMNFGQFSRFLRNTQESRRRFPEARRVFFDVTKRILNNVKPETEGE
jgi:hypothetical protein